MADTVVVTDTGLGIYNSRLTGAGTEPKWMDVGSGTTAATASNTGLETTLSMTRQTGSASIVTSTTTNDSYQVSATFTATADITVAETVLMDADAAGSCFLRGTFTGIALSSADSLGLTIKATLDQA